MPLPTPAQVLARFPTFGYQTYFASPEAAEELQYVKEFFLAGMLSPQARAAQSARGTTVEEDERRREMVRGDNMSRAVKQLVAAKQAGKLEFTLRDKVRRGRAEICGDVCTR